MKNLSLIIILFFVSAVNAQNPSIIWQKTFGGNLDDFGTDIIKVESTGELFIIGFSNSGTTGEKTQDSFGENDIWLIKTDEIGNVLWDKTIGGSINDGANTYAIVKDDLIYLITSSNSPISGNKTAVNYGVFDYWLVCLNLDGDILWEKTYGGLELDRAAGISELTNGNILIYGNSSSGISGNKSSELIGGFDYWILEVNPSDGSIIQEKSIGTENFNTIISAQSALDGNIYVYGYETTGINTDKTDEGFGGADLWLVKLDSDFNILADKCFGGDAMDYALKGGELYVYDSAIYLTIDSESGISGNKTTPHYGYQDFWLIKIDFDLNLIWDRTFGGNYRDYVKGVIVQPADKIILFGSSSSIPSGNKTALRYGESDDYWMIILDEDGNEISQETYGGLMDDVGPSVIGDNHGNLYVLGSSESNIGGLKTENSRGEFDYWLLKLDASDFLSLPEKEENFFLSVYPNPFHDNVSFNFAEHTEPIQLAIYSIDGQLIFQKKIPTSLNHFNWQAPTANTSVYIYQLTSSDIIQTGKLVKGGR